MVQGEYPTVGKRFESSPKHVGRVWGAPNLLLNGYCGSLRSVKWPWHEVNQ
jgi:hypothetical protein